MLAPGERFGGTITWELDRGAAPGREVEDPKLELRLFWYTRGRGNEDVAIADRLVIEDPGASGSRDFSFTLPAGPLSFGGKLITLSWALELVALPEEWSERVDLLVSTTGVPILFGESEPAEESAS